MHFKAADVSVEYTKNKQLRKEDVKALQQWAEKQPHLPDITELQLILFLHSCYFSLEAAKTCIDNYYTVRNHWPECFSNRDLRTGSTNFLDVCLFTPLPKLTPENYRVMYTRLLNGDANKYVFSEQAKNFDMNMMLWLTQEGTHEGLIIVVDMQYTRFAHMTRLSIVSLKKFFFYLQEAMPIRLRGVHFINVVSFIDKLMSLLKPFIKKELLDLLCFHTNSMENLYKTVPKECLPQDFGGLADSISELHVSGKKRLIRNADYFKEEEKQVADESKRIGKPKTEGDIFGVEGSFKKLNID